MSYSNGFKLIGTCLSGLGLIFMASISCGPTSQTVPPDEFGRVYPVALRLKNGSPLLKIEFSSRGIQKLTTVEEPGLDWIYQGAYSAWGLHGVALVEGSSLRLSGSRT